MRKFACRFTPVIVITGLAMLAGPFSYAQGTSDGQTPANEGVCDELLSDGVTKGLYGLCVAFCEAQDCEATVDEATGEVTFDASCNPSNPKLLENYNQRKTDTDPHMPCVNVMETECPCWTEEELATVAEQATTRCVASATRALLDGWSYGQNETALALPASCFLRFCSGGWECDLVIRSLWTTEDEFLACRDSIAMECEDRGY